MVAASQGRVAAIRKGLWPARKGSLRSGKGRGGQERVAASQERVAAGVNHRVGRREGRQRSMEQPNERLFSRRQ